MCKHYLGKSSRDWKETIKERIMFIKSERSSKLRARM
jgi:hypothetical protein